jgi:subtilisin-like proprotein convertase family protein
LAGLSLSLFLSMLLAGLPGVWGCSSDPGGGADPGQSDVGDTAAVGDTPAEAAPSSDVPAEALAGATSALTRVDCTAPTSALVITELMIRPQQVPDLTGEWIEIHNPGAAEADITGYTLDVNGVQVPLAANPQFPSVKVPAGGYIVLCKSLSNNGGISNCAYEYGTTLNLQNDVPVTVTLLDKALPPAVVDQVAYSGGPGAAPLGASVAMKHPYLDNANLSLPPAAPVWAASTATYGNGDKGTPGAKNTDVYEEHEFPNVCVDTNPCTWNRCLAGACDWAAFKDGCCTSNADCNQGGPCSAGTCNVADNTCTYTPVKGCCMTAADCVDENPCNNDWCHTDHTCRHSAYNTMPGCCYAPTKNPATGDPWTPAEGIAFADSMCDDKNVCTVGDHCDLVNNVCVPGQQALLCCTTNQECDDGDTCTYDHCVDNDCKNDDKPGCCNDSNKAVKCNDNDPCTRDECIVGKCMHIFKANDCCTDDNWCDLNYPDSNPCTDEKCVFENDPNDPKFGYRVCKHNYNVTCKMDLPFIETFNEPGETVPSKIGWKIIDYGTKAVAHWLMTAIGDLSQDQLLDKFLKFKWDPSTLLVKSVAATPILDAFKNSQSTYNPLDKTTVQWRQIYKHAPGGKPITLRAVASGDEYVTYQPLYRQGTTTPWEVTVDQDLEYSLESCEVPPGLWDAPNLRIGFMVDTGSAPTSTFDMDSWQIDDVKIGHGVANVYKKAVILRCKDGATTCSQQIFDKKIGEYPAGTELPEFTLGVNDWYLILMCYKDADANSASWNAFGYPTGYLDGAPLDAPGFVSLWEVQAGLVAVKYACGNNTDYNFYVGFYVKPNANDDYAGWYHMGLVAQDAYKAGVAPHEPFESLQKFNVNVMLASGYVVWAPNGTTDPAAEAIKDAIKAAGKKVQIIRDITKVGDLTKFSGVFAVLGVYGKNHAMTDAEALKLKGYLDAGGRVYVEGGDFWWTGPGGGQLPTQLHTPTNYFGIEARSDGAPKLAGPLTGRNFLTGYGFNASQGFQVNSWNDQLAHQVLAAGKSGREILRQEGASTFATTVALEANSPVAPNKLYRTLGSSFAFNGLVEKGQHTRNELMTKYLYFFEFGFPPCGTDPECDDFEVCTNDHCVAGACDIQAEENCVPCKDDVYADDGSYSCSQDPMNDRACVLAQGRCQDIGYCPGDPTLCTQVYQTRRGKTCEPATFGKSPTTRTCPLTVSDAGFITDLQVRARVTHPYRGDVRLTLTSPAGTTVVLRTPTNTGDSGDNVYQTWDLGLAPDQALSAFDGEPLNGVWTLKAEDLEPLVYNGKLDEWYLYATYTAPPCNVDADCQPVFPATLPNCVGAAVCVNFACQYVPLDCNDDLVCTDDTCNADTGLCEHVPSTFCPGGCQKHYPDCGNHGVCLDMSYGGAVCGQANSGKACNSDADCDDPDHEQCDLVKHECHNQCACSEVIADLRIEKKYNPDLAIPDGDPIPVTSKITVTPSQAQGVVRDVRVKVNPVHPSIIDLKVDLCHLGACVQLEEHTAGGPVPGFYKVYDYDPPLLGAANLDDLKGLVAAGDWELRIADDVADGNQGALHWWTLYLDRTECYKDADCADTDPCTIDKCSVAQDQGICSHEQKGCDPASNTDCQENKCDSADGQCKLKARNNGGACEDGDWCTVGETCSSGTCSGGAARDCSILDDGCIKGECDGVLKACKPVNIPEGGACDDGEICTQGETCISGVCTAPVDGGGICICNPDQGEFNNPACTDGDLCNGTMKCNLVTKRCDVYEPPKVCPPSGEGCKVNKCIPLTGACVLQNAPNYLNCDDGLVCTQGDLCESGICKGTIPLDCSSLDDACNEGVCEEGTGCVKDPLADDTLCENGDGGCTIDKCQAGVCTHVDNVLCSEQECNDSYCLPIGWGGFQCMYTAVGDGGPCSSDSDPCTDDVCRSGECQHERVSHCVSPCGGLHAYDAGDQMCGYDDSCVNGTMGNPNGTCTLTCEGAGCDSQDSGPINLPILYQGAGGTLVSTINLDMDTTGDGLADFLYVKEAHVKAHVSHTAIGDLVIDVVDPQNYAHPLWNNIGGPRDNFADTFDKSIPVPFKDLNQAPPQVVDLDSGVPMCSLRGEKATVNGGSWRLRIRDTNLADGGVLRSWKMVVKGTNKTPQACRLDADCTGAYAGDACLKFDGSACAGTPGCQCASAWIDTNPGHRCEDAIDLGLLDINPAVTVKGSTGCGLYAVNTGCGGTGPQRIYKFTIGVPKRITITLQQPDRDLVLFLKPQTGGTCPASSLNCRQTAGWTPLAAPEVIDRQIQPGTYYVGVGTNSTLYDYGQFQFDIRLKTLVADGGACKDDFATPDLDCLSNHCANGFCCGSDEDDPVARALLQCCPAPEWTAPPNDHDPYEFCTLHPAEPCDFAVNGNDDCQQGEACNPYKGVCMLCDDSHPINPTGVAWSRTNLEHPDWLQNEACPDFDYRAAPGDPGYPMRLLRRVAVCGDSELDPANPGRFMNDCQGARIDAVCENFICNPKVVDDDSACTDSVRASECGHWMPIQCGSVPPGCVWSNACQSYCNGSDPGAGQCVQCLPCVYGLLTGAQIMPTCEVSCDGDVECDLDSHCDPAGQATTWPSVVPLVVDDVGGHTMICTPDLVNGSRCNEDGDCASGHCDNGFCCDSGNCCPLDTAAGADECVVKGWKTDPVCSAATTCDGWREDPTCIDNRCGKVLVYDDCACGRDHEQSDACGLFREVYCYPAQAGCPSTPLWDGQTNPSPADWSSPKPKCRESCRKDCRVAANCGPPFDLQFPGDACRNHANTGACVDNGAVCHFGGQWDCNWAGGEVCLSLSTGLACASGNNDCKCTSCMCQKSEDEGNCDDTVQGVTEGAHCDPVAVVPATACTTDANCTGGAYCDLLTKKCVKEKTCQADVPNGAECNENTDCANKDWLPGGAAGVGNCRNWHCCDSLTGDCCGQPDGGSGFIGDRDDCPVKPCPTCQPPVAPGNHWTAPICDDTVSCQGHRHDAICVNFTCGDEPVDDDSACTTSDFSKACDFYKSVYCNGHQEQGPAGTPCPETCRKDCRSNSHCDAGDTCKTPQGAACTGTGDACLSDADCQVDLGSGIDYSRVCLRAGGSRCSGQADCVCTACKCVATEDNTRCEDGSGFGDTGQGRCDPDWTHGQPASLICQEKERNCIADGLGGFCEADAAVPTQCAQPVRQCAGGKAEPGQCDETTDCYSSYCQMHYCCDAGGCCKGCRVSDYIPSFGSGGTGDRDPVNPNTNYPTDDILPTHTFNGKAVMLQSSFGQSSPDGADAQKAAKPQIGNFGIMPGTNVQYGGQVPNPGTATP